MTGHRVLVIDSNESLRGELESTLTKEGYQVHLAECGEAGLQLAAQVVPDLVVLDLVLPDMDGLEVCQTLAQNNRSQVLVLTTRNEEADRILCLETGACDYITKPFSRRELLARIKAKSRRASQYPGLPSTNGGPQIFQAGDLELNLTRHTATLGDRPLVLKPKEFQLLTLLVHNRGRLCSKANIINNVWGGNDFISYHTVAVHIRWLREKVETDPGHPKRIITVRGYGYRFDG